MREIKFRGVKVKQEGWWDTEKWAYGYLVKCGDKYYIIEEPEYKIYDIDCGDYTNEFDCIEGYIYEVIPETIGRFTGLYDKNNVEIYEGDIVKVKSEKAKSCENFEFVGEVNFAFGCFNIGEWSINELIDNNCEYEVIGNICENPNY